MPPAPSRSTGHQSCPVCISGGSVVDVDAEVSEEVSDVVLCADVELYVLVVIGAVVVVVT